MTLFYYDPICLQHETGQHPECPARIQTLLAALKKYQLIEQCQTGTYEACTQEQIDALGVHDTRVLRRVLELAQRGGGRLDPDTVVSRNSADVALTIAGICLAAVDAVMEQQDRNAFCLIRPPGHHATSDRSMGFCLLNNIALAANHARKKHSLSRILIVDWDVHHGNGTQDIFYEDPHVNLLSIHRFGQGFYPGTGEASETGTGPGLGHTCNIPVQLGTSRQDYLSTFRYHLETMADKIRPELILLSAGFDADARDPVGSLGLETEDFYDMSKIVLGVADVHCQGRVVSCLEGGYNLQALEEAVVTHLIHLMKK